MKKIKEILQELEKIGVKEFCRFGDKMYAFLTDAQYDKKYDKLCKIKGYCEDAEGVWIDCIDGYITLQID